MSASGGPLDMSREQSEQLAASMAATQRQFRSLAEAFVVSLRPAVEETERRMAAFLEGLRRSMGER